MPRSTGEATSEFTVRAKVNHKGLTESGLLFQAVYYSVSNLAMTPLFLFVLMDADS